MSWWVSINFIYFWLQKCKFLVTNHCDLDLKNASILSKPCFGKKNIIFRSNNCKKCIYFILLMKNGCIVSALHVTIPVLCTGQVGRGRGHFLGKDDSCESLRSSTRIIYLCLPPRIATDTTILYLLMLIHLLRFRKQFYCIYGKMFENIFKGQRTWGGGGVIKTTRITDWGGRARHLRT